MVQSILVPVDGSELSARALDIAARSFVEPEITVIHVIDPMNYVGGIGGEEAPTDTIAEQREQHAEDILEDARSHLESVDIASAQEVRVGDVAREVVAFADASDTDHIVLGSHGRTGIERFLLGSVAEKVVRRSPVPVTVVR